MQLVVGLGNPGRRYALTRHNIGYRCVEALAKRLRLSFAETRPFYRAATGEGPAGPVSLVLPLTYMNRSGEALRAWSRDTGWEIGPADRQGESDAPMAVPVVVCDDLNLGLGSLRIRGRGGDGGQKGLASLIRVVRSEELPRMRLGIAPPGEAVAPDDWSTYVLDEFDPQENDVVEELIGQGVEALSCLLIHGWQYAATRYNRRI
jgi:peptidyl-tRNA hydrolase, PTH1 family